MPPSHIPPTESARPHNLRGPTQSNPRMHSWIRTRSGTVDKQKRRGPTSIVIPDAWCRHFVGQRLWKVVGLETLRGSWSSPTVALKRDFSSGHKANHFWWVRFGQSFPEHRREKDGPEPWGSNASWHSKMHYFRTRFVESVCANVPNATSLGFLLVDALKRISNLKIFALWCSSRSSFIYKTVWRKAGVPPWEGEESKF